MTSYSPFSGRRVASIPPRLSRALWTMRSSIGKEIMAGIYDVATGRELRITLGEHLLESQLSRTADAALEKRASEVQQVLALKGWARVPAEHALHSPTS